MSNYSRLVEIFEKLVSFHTVTGEHDAAADCLQYVESILAPSGMAINRYRSNGFHSLVATSQPTKKPKVLFQAHLDVVPGNKKLFTLQGQGEKLVGRGAYDMKYAAACYVWIVEELGRSVSDYDFGVMFTTDEEEGGLNGVDYLLDQGYSCEVCIIPDGGDNWLLESRAKGLWHVDAIADGISAHGSRPWDGTNAAEKLLGFVDEVKPLTKFKDHTDTTIVLSRLLAGEARNQVPNKAVASFDIRFLNQDALDTIRAKLKVLAQKHDIELVTDQQTKAIELDVTQPLVQVWETIVRNARGANHTEGYALSFGASDARFFADQNIPTIVTRPDGGGMHANNEWIDEAGLYQFADCLREYLVAVASNSALRTDGMAV